MPTIGPFHGRYWKARANTPPPAGTGGNTPMYKEWQSTIQRSLTLSMAVWWVPMPASISTSLGRLGRRLIGLYRIGRRLWQWYGTAEHLGPDQWTPRLDRLDLEQLAVLERVIAAFDSPGWGSARLAVRQCATTPKFHQPEQWIAYSRAIKANPGQAQNVFRHLKAVSDLRSLDDGPAAVSNPEAHLLVELAYQGMAALGRANRTVA